MSPLTNTRPKPLVKVAGRALLDHALAQCDGLKVVVNAHYFADQIQNHVAGCGIIVSNETDALLETGGGLKRALSLLGSDPVVTMNTDAVWRGSNPIQALLKTWRPNDMDALLLMVPRASAIGHTGTGDFDVDPEGRLTRGKDTVYSGVQIIKTKGLKDITQNAFSMWELWNPMLAKGTMYGTMYDGKWCDVGRPDSIEIAEEMLAEDTDV